MSKKNLVQLSKNIKVSHPDTELHYAESMMQYFDENWSAEGNNNRLYKSYLIER